MIITLFMPVCQFSLDGISRSVGKRRLMVVILAGNKIIVMMVIYCTRMNSIVPKGHHERKRQK